MVVNRPIFSFLIRDFQQARNAYTHENMQINPLRIVQQCRSTFHKILQQKEGESIQRRRWSPPWQGGTKLNCDAGYSEGRGYFGAIIRDDCGDMILGASGPLMSHGILRLEAEAVLFGLQMLIRIHILEVEVESDNLTVTTLLEHGDIKAPWAIDDVISRCRSLIPLFSKISFTHIPREANSAAHALASEGKSQQSTSYYLVQPDVVRQCIYYDKSVSCVRCSSTLEDYWLQSSLAPAGYADLFSSFINVSCRCKINM